MNLKRHDWKENPEIIIVFREKHENQYFIARSTEEVLKIFYKIFKERLESGYWYRPMEAMESDLQVCDTNISEIEKLLSTLDPDSTSPVVASQRNLLQKQLQSFKNSKRETEADIKEMKVVLEKTEPSFVHYYFLDHRRRHEYEEFLFEYPQDHEYEADEQD